MQLLPPPEPRWTLHGPDWVSAVRRLSDGEIAGPLETALLTPLVDHFESAWLHLRQLALVAERIAPAPDQSPLPIHHLAAFIVDDVVDVFRGAASELVQLIPSDDPSAYAPSPIDVVEEGGRFSRLLVVAGMAARNLGAPDLLSETTARVAAALERWADGLPPLMAPVTEALAATNYGAGNAFGGGPGSRLTH